MRDHGHPGWSALIGTPGRIAGLLRQGGMTVEELATALALTGNAVRAHLARLERDRIVVRAEVRRGVSRPAVVYGIAPEAEPLFSRAYVPVLTQLLEVLAARLRPADFDRLMRQVGRGLLGGRSAPAGPLRQRAEAASALLNELGGISRVESVEDTLVIRGYGCPLAAASRAHPEVCNAVESLLSAFIDGPVSTCCDRDVRMRCCFRLGPAAKPRRPAGARRVRRR